MVLTQEQVQESLNRGGVTTLPAGTHRFSDLVVPVGSTLAGQDGAVLEGSRAILATAWKSSGDIRYAPYTQLPVQDGHGITFSTGMNLNDALGKHADQAWTRADGDTRLRRVANKGAVVRGKFAVQDGSIWVHKDDAAAGILVSDKRRAFKSIAGTVRNVAVKRYSPTPGDGAAVRIVGGWLEDCEIDSCSFVSVMLGGTDSTVMQCRITRAGWMGIAASLATNVLVDAVQFAKVNDWGVFALAPQSGALKTSRCRQVTVVDSRVSETVGHGLWFDQSTSDVTVADCFVEVRGGSGVFFEISHGLTAYANNIIAEQDGIKVAGASGVVIVGNAIRGSRHAVGIWMDKRSIAGYSDPRNPITPEMHAAGVYASDRRSVEWRDDRITWLPRVEVLERNTLQGGKGNVYVLTTNGDATRSRAQIVPLGHQ